MSQIDFLLFLYVVPLNKLRNSKKEIRRLKDFLFRRWRRRNRGRPEPFTIVCRYFPRFIFLYLIVGNEQKKRIIWLQSSHTVEVKIQVDYLSWLEGATVFDFRKLSLNSRLVYSVLVLKCLIVSTQNLCYFKLTRLKYIVSYIKTYGLSHMVRVLTDTPTLPPPPLSTPPPPSLNPTTGTRT